MKRGEKGRLLDAACAHNGEDFFFMRRGAAVQNGGMAEISQKSIGFLWRSDLRGLYILRSMYCPRTAQAVISSNWM